MALVTFTSDIGTSDYLVGAIKGQLLHIEPQIQLVDITHTISRENFPRAAYICRNAIRSFPEQSFHLIMVNLFDGNTDHLLLAFHRNQYFLCADNGLLTMILEDKPELVIGLPFAEKENRNALGCARSFGNAIRGILSGQRLQDIGTPDVAIVEKNHLQPLLSDNWMEGQIIFIDNFENVVVNITREQFEKQRKGRNFQIIFKRDEVIDRISHGYSDVQKGEKLAYFNAAGYLEIAINNGNAAGLFGLEDYLEKKQNPHLQNRLFYQTVRIHFT